MSRHKKEFLQALKKEYLQAKKRREGRMGEEGMPDGEWPSLDFDLDMGSDFDLDDLGNLEDFLDADFERGFEDFKRDAESGAWNPWGGGLSGF